MGGGSLYHTPGRRPQMPLRGSRMASELRKCPNWFLVPLTGRARYSAVQGLSDAWLVGAL